MIKVYYIVPMQVKDYSHPRQGFMKTPSVPNKEDGILFKDIDLVVKDVYYQYVKQDDAYMPHLTLTQG